MAIGFLAWCALRSICKCFKIGFKFYPFFINAKFSRKIKDRNFLKNENDLEIFLEFAIHGLFRTSDVHAFPQVTWLLTKERNLNDFNCLFL